MRMRMSNRCVIGSQRYSNSTLTGPLAMLLVLLATSL